MTPPPALNLLVLRCADPEATRLFYSALGLSFRREQHGRGPEHFSCDAGAILPELYPLREGAALDDALRPQEMLGLRVASLEEALSALRSLGAEPQSPPRDSEWGRWASVLDPDERAVRLTEG